LWKKALVLVTIVLFVGAGFIPSISGAIGNLNELNSGQSIVTFHRGILYVGGSGPNNYTAIQAAVNDASNGDTVFVYDDSSPYYEKVVVNKTIDLIGENRDTTIIDGIGYEDVVYVSSDWVTISGFTIRNGGHEGVVIVSNYNTFTGNTISNNNYGIVFVGSSNITISGNII